MSEPATISRIAPGETRARDAIARAADRTGADFSYLLAQAKLESSLDPQARARTSSAAGLYQFIDSTWLATLDRHGTAHGLDGVADAIEMRGGRARVADPALRGQIMALRFDPDTAALMAGELAQDNRAQLAPVLGRDPDASELYLAHFLGAAGATRFLTALGTGPQAPAAALMPQAAAANRSIFYTPGGAPRSLGGVMDLIRDKLEVAMSDEGGLPYPATASDHFASARAGWQVNYGRQSASAGDPAPAPESAALPSMAETLRSSFALAGGGGSAGRSDHVQSAYGKLRAFNL